MTENEYDDAHEKADNPPTPERPMGGPDSDNQPPPPPAESDPKQDTGDDS